MTNLIRIFTILCCVFTTYITHAENKKLRDPTTPIVKDPSGLKIQGIAESEGESYCLINDKIYKEGDTILDFTIVKIEIDKVHFSDFEGMITEISL